MAEGSEVAVSPWRATVMIDATAGARDARAREKGLVLDSRDHHYRCHNLPGLVDAYSCCTAPVPVEKDMFMKTKISQYMGICQICGYPILRNDIIMVSPGVSVHALCTKVS